ncbi:hypothetical protein A359_03700 [secondary endosymbiont of Ctenarytaina eucalypti]|uniref:Uncharacterized protein n=1 Tax=secondary endosymbiont of Ctenarytaina eucalypti TaxID=1199245 RepID=J3TX97_9ENTR|nr:hypothetical protein A359_03700 [secondary endosymbiont of Ctenarytaina eucalypti]
MHSCSIECVCLIEDESPLLAQNALTVNPCYQKTRRGTIDMLFRNKLLKPDGAVSRRIHDNPETL